MRAATLIVGAFAVSCCLIALALVLSTSGDSDQSTPAARTPSAEKQGAAKSEAPSATSESAPESGADQCTVEAVVDGGPCLLGKSALEAYERTGEHPGKLSVVDPGSGEEVTLDCAESGPTICKGPGGVIVYLAR